MNVLDFYQLNIPHNSELIHRRYHHPNHHHCCHRCCEINPEKLDKHMICN